MPSAFAEAERILVTAREKIGASSCCFYVRDPWWKDEFQLLLFPGVHFTEPMYGFMFPASSKEVIAGGKEARSWFKSVKDSPLWHHAQSQTLLPQGLSHSKKALFESFPQREKVVSCARLQYRRRGALEAVLFVNFSKKTTFTSDRQRLIKRLMRDLVAQLPSLSERLLRIDNSPFNQLVHILEPMRQLAGPDSGNIADLQRNLLESILRAALRAFGLDRSNGLGTIHMIDHDKQALRLVASQWANREPLFQNLNTVQGIASWVALTERSLLIEDLKNSAFEDIYVPRRRGIRSELAVPMFAGDNLLGVLNLESTKVSAFPPQSVRTIWYAANQVSIAYHLSRQTSENKRLSQRTTKMLEYLQSAVSAADKDSSPRLLDGLAELVCHQFGTLQCDIWQHKRDEERFVVAGANYKPFDPIVRDQGWTDYVRRTKVPVWITDIRNQKRFKALFWNSDERAWSEDPPQSGLPAPQLLNERLVKKHVSGDLGIPILVRQDCLGVAWLHHKTAGKKLINSPPSATLAEAKALLGPAGLAMDCLQHHQEIVERGPEEEVAAQIQGTLFPSGKLDLPNVSGYVICKPYRAVIGSDFYAAAKIDDRSTGILLGDAQGHGKVGALPMLAFMAAFQAVFRETRSTSHVLNKLFRIAFDLGTAQTSDENAMAPSWVFGMLKGSLVYFILTMVGNKKWLIASTAGHPPLIILKSDGRSDFFPSVDHIDPSESQTSSPTSGGLLGIHRDPLFAQEFIEVKTGEVVIAYTDGVGDSRHIISAASGNLEMEPEQIARAIEKASNAKAPRDPQGRLIDGDDITIVVIKVR